MKESWFSLEDVGQEKPIPSPWTNSDRILLQAVPVGFMGDTVPVKIDSYRWLNMICGDQGHHTTLSCPH